MDTNEYRDVINKSDRALMAAEEVVSYRVHFEIEVQLRSAAK